MKYFIITVDTEGDNLWDYKAGEEINTRNAEYIPRFQKLCEKYGFKPVYLTNYEMANSTSFVNNAKEWLNSNSCEIGVHLHAWNNPPLVALDGPYTGNPYLIEYDDKTMQEKFDLLYNLIKTNFGIKPISHRAGRWAMDKRYFQLLKRYGIIVDCSYTPGVSWEGSKGVKQGGSDYTKEPKGIQWIEGILEVPATLRNFRNISNGSFKHRIKSLLLGEDVWLRPAMSSYNSMKKVLDKVSKEDNVDFVEFMLHSSELMPGGSPYFKTGNSVEEEYRVIDALFSYAIRKGFVGVTLKEYYKKHENTSNYI